MNDAARLALRKLVEEFGAGIARDHHRLGALLRDDCGECKREINVLLDAAEEEVVDALRSPAQGSLEVAQRVLAKRLHEARGTDEAAALWGVNAWAYALALTETSAPGASPAAGIAAAAGARTAPPISAPAPAAPAAPAPSLAAIAQRYLRKNDGRWNWVVVGGVAAVLLLVAWLAIDTSSMRIDKVEHPATFPADNTPVVFNILFSGADAVQVERKVTRGGWKDGTHAISAENRAKGALPITVRATSPEKATFQLTLVDSAGNRSKPFEVEFEATAPSLRIASVEYPKQVAAGDRDAKIAVRYAGGDVVKLEVAVQQGSMKGWSRTYKPDGKLDGTVTIPLNTAQPERVALRLMVTDAAGRASAPYDIELQVVPGRQTGPSQLVPDRQTGTTPAGRGSAPRIVDVRYPPVFPADRSRQSLKIQFEDPDGDVVRVEVRPLLGSWRTPPASYQMQGQVRGTLDYDIWTDQAGPGQLQLTVVDAKGNRSAPYTVEFVALPAGILRR